MTNTADQPLFFGEWVKNRRGKLDLTQSELADRAGCSVHAIRKIESGERRPSKQLAGLLANSLQIEQDQFPTFIRVARGDLNIERLSLTNASIRGTEFETASNVHVNVPFPSTPLIGRESELAAVEKKYEDPHCRLLTLTGQGGVGKTRLAVEFANTQGAKYPGGVIYVPLVSIDQPEFIVPAIAEAMGVSFSGPADPKHQLFNRLTESAKLPVLFVLDNMEHLLASNADVTGHGQAVELVGEMLQQFPNLKILITSRERLNLRGEWVYELHGLRVPSEEVAEKYKASSAIELFVQSATRVKNDFEVGGEELAALINLCRKLEGIPLAIELAAAWVELLSIEEIAQEINTNLAFLATSLQDIPDRHRSLKATFEHSWNLLADDERSVLSKLTVFRGGFTRGAAEEVVGASLPLLGNLMSKSLLHRAEDGRYDLHEVIRQFASTYLDEDPHCPDTCDAHCRYYLTLVTEAEGDLKSSRQQIAFKGLKAEIDNIRTAWNWAINNSGYIYIDQCARSLGWFFEIGGLLTEGVEYFDQLIERLLEAKNQQWEKLLGKALAYQSLLLFRKGQFNQAQNQLERSVELLRSAGEEALLIDPLVYLGVIMHLHGNLPESRRLMEEALQYAEMRGDQWFEAYAIFNLGYVESLEGNHDAGYKLMLRGLDIWRELGDPLSISLGLNFISPTLIKKGFYRDAIDGLGESLELSSDAKHRWGMGTAFRYLGLAYMGQGKQAEAQDYFLQSIDMFSDYVTGWDIAQTLIYMAESFLLMEEIDQAEEKYLHALEIAAETNTVPLELGVFIGLAKVYLEKALPERSLKLASYLLENADLLEAEKEQLGKILEEATSQLSGKQVDEAADWAENQTREMIAEKLLARQVL